MITLTAYFPGDTPEDALEGLPFDYFDAAEEFREDNNLAHVFSATFQLVPNSIEVVTDN